MLSTRMQIAAVYVTVKTLRCNSTLKKPDYVFMVMGNLRIVCIVT